MTTTHLSTRKAFVSSIPLWMRTELLGRKQTRLAYQDEVNVFRRTLLYAGPPRSARWYDVAGPGQQVGARAMLYLRRRDGVTDGKELPHYQR